MSAITCIEQFAGPGGMSEAMKLAGMDPAASVGIEFDKDACDTAEANGHPRVHVDITRLNPDTFARHFGITRLVLLHGSPPCQGFSMAGNGLGRKDTALILKAIAAMKRGDDPKRVVQRLAELAEDDKSALCLYPLYWAIVLRPENVSMEQVATVLPLWVAVADCLEHFGYSTWTGNVQAEQYGVPQTRKRAILLASRVRTVAAPEPTHSKFHNRNPERLDEGVLPWVSMAQALGWDGFKVVSNYGSGGDPAARGERDASHPAATITSKAGRNRIELSTPDGSDVELLHRRDSDSWVAENGPRSNRTGDKPAPTVTGESHRWDWRRDGANRVTHMGDVYNSKGCIRSVDEPAPTMTASMDNGNFRFFDTEQGKKRSARVTPQEAAILQSFPAEYVWKGNRTSVYQQIGNAVPPVLGAAMLRRLLADELEQSA